MYAEPFFSNSLLREAEESPMTPRSVVAVRLAGLRSREKLRWIWTSVFWLQGFLELCGRLWRLFIAGFSLFEHRMHFAAEASDAQGQGESEWQDFHSRISRLALRPRL